MTSLPPDPGAARPPETPLTTAGPVVGEAAGPAVPHVIGIDLSLTGTGISDGKRAWTITSKGAKTASLDQRRRRLDSITEDIACACLGAQLVVIEGPSFGQQRQGGQHDRAGLWWLVVAHLLGALEVPVVEVPPASLKTYATGKGNASKDQVLAAVVRRYLEVDVADNNAADALVLAAMGYRHLGQPIDDMPLTHARGMSKVAWPDNDEPGF